MKKVLFGLGLGLFWMVNACSSDSQQQQEAVETSENDDAAEVEDNENDELENDEGANEISEGILTGDGQPNERVVVFVVQDETPVYAEPSPDSATVGTVMQGDPLVVYATSQEWGQISSGRYIEMNSTSPSLVPRSKGYNKWIAQESQ